MVRTNDFVATNKSVIILINVSPPFFFTAKQSVSPVKAACRSRLSFLDVRRSPPKLSPIKTPETILQTPRKMREVPGEDVRRTPRKQSTPLRLGRQGGECICLVN